MKGSTALLRVNNYDYARLSAELDMCPQACGRVREKLEEYLYYRGIDTLDHVNVQVLSDYFEYIIKDSYLTDRQKKYYTSALELSMLSYLSGSYAKLLSETADIGKGMRASRNKVLVFLMVSGISNATEITYQLRCDIENYMKLTAPRQCEEVLKILDKIKLFSIDRKNADNIRQRRELKDPTILIYLGYHPDYNVAMSFYYIQNKNELVFDFSRDVSLVLRKQFLDMLNHSLRIGLNRKNRREMYLLPLKLFYEYCCSYGIKDINLLEQSDIDGFYKSLDGNVGTKTKIYMQIIDNFRRFLFMQGSKINWDANVWYPERFRLNYGRVNPAHSMTKFTFIEVKDRENRRLLKKYMRYLFGLTGKSVSMIRGLYYWIKEFLIFCDGEGIRAENLTAVQAEKYAAIISDSKIQNEYKNSKIYAVARFYNFLEVEGIIEKCPFDPKFYRKKEYPVHHDRCVSDEIVSEILKNLGRMREDYRLIFLHLFFVGLRINEVCTLKGDAYFSRNDSTWIKVFQYKLKSEKVIPIPEKLKSLMDQYIKNNAIDPEEYVFKAKKGGPCKCATFNKYMQKWCKDMKIGGGEYHFRSHDFRHRLATSLYDAGISIQAVRDYLGHKEDDMTRQYIDYMPKRLDAASEKYFEENDSFKIREERYGRYYNRRT